MNLNQGMPPRRKKTLFVITKSNFGGAQRYVYDLATNLPSESFDVAVAFGGDGLLAQMLGEKNIRAIPVPALERDVNIAADISAFFALIKLFKKERPDVVHLNSSKAGGLGALAARIAGVLARRSHAVSSRSLVRRRGEVGPHIIFTAHGWPFWEKRNALARAIIFLLSYVTVLLSHCTVCISRFDQSAMARMPFIKRKLRVIRNGISDISFLPRDGARAALFSPAEIDAHADDLWLISNGELTANKNYFAGIDAVAAYNARHKRKIFYSIMSDGEQRKEIERYIVSEKLETRVKLLGFVPDGRRYLRAFDIFFLPSKKEGVPYVILEAAAAMVPVVASDVGGIPEIIEDGESGYLRASGDVAGFTEALGKLAEDPSLRERMSKKLADKISRDFSLASMLERTLSLY